MLPAQSRSRRPPQRLGPGQARNAPATSLPCWGRLRSLCRADVTTCRVERPRQGGFTDCSGGLFLGAPGGVDIHRVRSIWSCGARRSKADGQRTDGEFFALAARCRRLIMRFRGRQGAKKGISPPSVAPGRRWTAGDGGCFEDGGDDLHREGKTGGAGQLPLRPATLFDWQLRGRRTQTNTAVVSTCCAPTRVPYCSASRAHSPKSDARRVPPAHLNQPQKEPRHTCQTIWAASPPPPHIGLRLAHSPL